MLSFLDIRTKVGARLNAKDVPSARRSSSEAIDSEVVEALEARDRAAEFKEDTAAEVNAADPEAEAEPETEDDSNKLDVAMSNKASDKDIDLSLESLEAELGRARHRRNYVSALRSTVYSLLIVAAAAVIIAMLVLPVLQITGASMTETLQDRDIVVAVRSSDYKTGDLAAFYYNNNILVKRVIATEGQWVDITEDGTVYVDKVRLDEPYVSAKALGECNIQLPYQVPDGKVFVMGDHRSTSVDSRSTTLGCVSEDMFIGRIFLRIWPLNAFGFLH